MLTKHDERKMPKNLGHIESLARSHTKQAVRVLAGIMNEPTLQPAHHRHQHQCLRQRRWRARGEGEWHMETGWCEFNDQTPLLEINPSKNGGTPIK
jgi:hypothetical protein